LATAAFAGLALLLAGRLPALVNLATANAVFLGLLMLSGMVFPLKKLPTGLRHLAQALPSTALAEILHGALGATDDIPTRAWIVLIIWATTAITLASSLFRWEPDHR
jgi:ABC-2 type transport system permease protein